VSTQPISDERLDRIKREHGWVPVISELVAALVAVRAERDDLNEKNRKLSELILEAEAELRKARAAVSGESQGASGPSPGEDGSVLRCSLAANHSPHCWAMYGDDDSPWYRCPGEETP
jgi:hypothetical protein